MAQFIESFRWDEKLKAINEEVGYAFRKGMQNTYIGDFDSIEVHHINTGKEEMAYLFDRECLKSIDLYHLTHETVVDISHQPAEEEDKILLELCVDIDVNIQKGKGYRFIKQ